MTAELNPQPELNLEAEPEQQPASGSIQLTVVGGEETKTKKRSRVKTLLEKEEQAIERETAFIWLASRRLFSLSNKTLFTELKIERTTTTYDRLFRWALWCADPVRFAEWVEAETEENRIAPDCKTARQNRCAWLEKLLALYNAYEANRLAIAENRLDDVKLLYHDIRGRREEVSEQVNLALGPKVHNPLKGLNVTGKLDMGMGKRMKWALKKWKKNGVEPPIRTHRRNTSRPQVVTDEPEQQPEIASSESGLTVANSVVPFRAVSSEPRNEWYIRDHDSGQLVRAPITHFTTLVYHGGRLYFWSAPYNSYLLSDQSFQNIDLLDQACLTLSLRAMNPLRRDRYYDYNHKMLTDDREKLLAEIEAEHKWLKYTEETFSLPPEQRPMSNTLNRLLAELANLQADMGRLEVAYRAATS